LPLATAVSYDAMELKNYDIAYHAVCVSLWTPTVWSPYREAMAHGVYILQTPSPLSFLHLHWYVVAIIAAYNANTYIQLSNDKSL